MKTKQGNYENEARIAQPRALTQLDDCASMAPRSIDDGKRACPYPEFLTWLKILKVSAFHLRGCPIVDSKAIIVITLFMLLSFMLQVHLQIRPILLIALIIIMIFTITVIVMAMRMLMEIERGIVIVRVRLLVRVIGI